MDAIAATLTTYNSVGEVHVNGGGGCFIPQWYRKERSQQSIFVK